MMARMAPDISHTAMTAPAVVQNTCLAERTLCTVPSRTRKTSADVLSRSSGMT